MVVKATRSLVGCGRWSVGRLAVGCDRYDDAMVLVLEEMMSNSSRNETVVVLELNCC